MENRDTTIKASSGDDPSDPESLSVWSVSRAEAGGQPEENSQGGGSQGSGKDSQGGRNNGPHSILSIDISQPMELADEMDFREAIERLGLADCRYRAVAPDGAGWRQIMPDSAGYQELPLADPHPG